jgi:hypothetical protein
MSVRLASALLWIALGAIFVIGMVSLSGPAGRFVLPVGFLGLGAFLLTRKNDPPLRVGPVPVPHTILGAITVVLSLASLYAIFVMAPVELQMGIVQKIFYFHVPSAYAMYVAFVVSAVGSAVYLWRRDERWDALAVSGAEVGLIFVIIVLITGPLWARKAWGTYWTWDPRLTTTLLAGMIYVAFNVLRGLGQAGEAEKRFASAGSWRWMSSESKMGCKYIQLRWQPSHSEVTSWTRRSRRSQSAIRSSKGPLYGEKENCCVSTMLSSSSVFTSSLSLMTEVPVLRYAITSKSCGG